MVHGRVVGTTATCCIAGSRLSAARRMRLNVLLQQPGAQLLLTTSILLQDCVDGVQLGRVVQPIQPRDPLAQVVGVLRIVDGGRLSTTLVPLRVGRPGDVATFDRSRCCLRWRRRAPITRARRIGRPRRARDVRLLRVRPARNLGVRHVGCHVGRRRDLVRRRRVQGVRRVVRRPHAERKRGGERRRVAVEQRVGERVGRVGQFRVERFGGRIRRGSRRPRAVPLVPSMTTARSGVRAGSSNERGIGACMRLSAQSRIITPSSSSGTGR